MMGSGLLGDEDEDAVFNISQNSNLNNPPNDNNTANGNIDSSFLNSSSIGGSSVYSQASRRAASGVGSGSTSKPLNYYRQSYANPHHISHVNNTSLHSISMLSGLGGGVGNPNQSLLSVDESPYDTRNTSNHHGASFDHLRDGGYYEGYWKAKYSRNRF